MVYEGTRRDAEASRCAALEPALGLIYTGRTALGQALFRKLYSRPDAMAVELEGHGAGAVEQAVD